MKADFSLANKMGRWRLSQKAPPPPLQKIKLGWGLEIDTHLYISCCLFSSFSFLPSFLAFSFLFNKEKKSFHTMLFNAVSYVNLKNNHVSWLLDFNILSTAQGHLRTIGGGRMALNRVK